MRAVGSRFTPTKAEELEFNAAKLAATKTSYETDALMSQVGCSTRLARLAGAASVTIICVLNIA